jgi:uncharacterized membrane protein (DUF373 family)
MSPYSADDENQTDTNTRARDKCHLLGSDDPQIDFLHRVIRYAVKALAFLMVFVILWGILDVLWVLYTKLSTPPHFLLNINDIFATFGAFMAVLIAIEIFANIVMYLESDIIHVRLVLDTAVMAAARKVIVLDFNELESMDVFALGAVLAALGVCYLFVAKETGIRIRG